MGNTCYKQRDSDGPQYLLEDVQWCTIGTVPDSPLFSKDWDDTDLYWEVNCLESHENVMDYPPCNCATRKRKKKLCPQLSCANGRPQKVNYNLWVVDPL